MSSRLGRTLKLALYLRQNSSVWWFLPGGIEKNRNFQNPKQLFQVEYVFMMGFNSQNITGSLVFSPKALQSARESGQDYEDLIKCCIDNP